MNLTPEQREAIANIIYQLNVDAEDVPPYVDAIAEIVGPRQINIDLAGAMEKITPEMMDTARDLMIDGLTKRCAALRDALEPFASQVFDDNGDMTVSMQYKREHYVNAYLVHKG